MALFLISLGVIFAATVLCLVVVRVQLTQRDQWPADLPRLPWSMALGTLVLLASSVTMERASGLARVGATGAGAGSGSGSGAGFRRAMVATASLGAMFLAIQAVGWLNWLSVVRDRWHGSGEFRLALTAFYVLTGLHGLHVLGGLVAIVRTLRGDRDPASEPTARRDRAHYCAMYWHFLGVVWLALYALLLIWS